MAKMTKGPLWDKAFTDLGEGRTFAYLTMMDSTKW